MLTKQKTFLCSLKQLPDRECDEEFICLFCDCQPTVCVRARVCDTQPAPHRCYLTGRRFFKWWPHMQRQVAFVFVVKGRQRFENEQFGRLIWLNLFIEWIASEFEHFRMQRVLGFVGHLWWPVSTFAVHARFTMKLQANSLLLLLLVKHDDNIGRANDSIRSFVTHHSSLPSAHTSTTDCHCALVVLTLLYIPQMIFQHF